MYIWASTCFGDIFKWFHSSQTFRCDCFQIILHDYLSCISFMYYLQRSSFITMWHKVLVDFYNGMFHCSSLEMISSGMTFIWTFKISHFQVILAQSYCLDIAHYLHYSFKKPFILSRNVDSFRGNKMCGPSIDLILQPRKILWGNATNKRCCMWPLFVNVHFVHRALSLSMIFKTRALKLNTKVFVELMECIDTFTNWDVLICVVVF